MLLYIFIYTFSMYTFGIGRHVKPMFCKISGVVVVLGGGRIGGWSYWVVYWRNSFIKQRYAISFLVKPILNALFFVFQWVEPYPSFW